MKQLTVISGKGGTGKTTLVASFAALAEGKVLADCDVDAADLHLVLDPEEQQRETFIGGRAPHLDPEICVECGECRERCRFDAVTEEYRIDSVACEGCGLCATVCPVDAIEMRSVEVGEWFVSDTPYGSMVHARLGIAEENSGKLVTMVRQQARLLGEEQGLDLVLIDGPPGIGCPVISAISGVDLVLAVTEPTLSGIHDLERILGVARHFGIPALVCVNKHDLNPENTERIRTFCAESGVEMVGVIPFDPTVIRALVEGKTIVEYADGPVAEAIRGIWARVAGILEH